MTLGLTIKNKLGFIDGSLSQSTDHMKNSWIICNSVVTAWILNSLSKEITISIDISDSAREICMA